jgi:hypothetical protein
MRVLNNEDHGAGDSSIEGAHQEIGDSLAKKLFGDGLRLGRRVDVSIQNRRKEWGEGQQIVV